MAAPEDWIGKQVTFGMEGANRFVSGELVEVSDRGIVLLAAGSSSPPPQVFYPWRVVRLIQLAPEQGEQPGQEESLSSGQEPTY